MSKSKLLIEAKGLSCHFEQTGVTLFDNIDLSLFDQRQFLVGNNGVGKSLLAHRLATDCAEIGGEVNRFGTVGYLSQGLDPFTGTVAQKLGVADILEANTRVMEGNGTEADFELLDGNWDIEARVDKVLNEGGLPQQVLNQRFESLSGGQRTRVSLSALRIAQPDFIILDEPTNHLDGQARHWFSQWLDLLPGVLIISHDRNLLRQAEVIFELSSGGIRRFRGGWESYLQSSEQLRQGIERTETLAKKQLQQAKKAQQAAVEKANSTQARGEQKRGSTNQSKIVLNKYKDNSEKAGSRNANLHAEQVKRLQKAHVQAAEQKAITDKLAFAVSDPSPVYGKALQIDNLILPMGSQQAITINLEPGERIAITGANGCGKSTLLKVLSGQLQAQSGKVLLAKHFAFLDQHFSLLKPALSALDNFMQIAPGWEQSQYRTVLAQVRLRKDKALYPVSSLSGGERLKVALATLCCGPSSPSILLLDEPDNHLDIESRELLEATLASYKGAIVLVSHDDEFIANAGVNQRLKLDTEAPKT